MISEQEVTSLINLLKKIIEGQVIIPENGERRELVCKSTSSKDEFIVSVFRRRISNSANYIARVKGSHLLIRMDVGASTSHINPDGKKVHGNHLHTYIDGYDLRYAFPFNVGDYNLMSNYLKFLEKFNVRVKNVFEYTRLDLN